MRTYAQPLVVDWPAYHARVRPSARSMVDADSNRRFSWAETHERVGCLASALVDMGIGPGDRVGFLALNSTDIIELILATWRIGAVGLALNYRLTSSELEYIVNDATPKLILVDEAHAALIEELEKTTDVPHWILTKSSGEQSPFESLISEKKPLSEMVEQPLGALCMLMYSSGTTGKPKGVKITHEMIFYSSVQAAGVLIITPETTAMVAMPLFHIAGLNVSATPGLRSGGGLVVVREFNPEIVLDLINDPELDINHFFAVPAAFNALRMHPKNETTDFSRLSAVTSGAESVPAALIHWWRDRGVVIQEGYGLTETAASATLLSYAQAQEKVGSAGQALIHVQIKIVDDDGQEVATGEQGEICIKGPFVTSGYWNRPDADEVAFRDGWFLSGDIGRMDDEGYVYIEDRKKDMYISGGENVYPSEIENVIYQFPEIQEVAIVGVPDEKWGEVGCAFIAFKEGQSFTLEDLQARCRDSLAKFKVPQYLREVDMLPRNGAGKVLKYELRSAFTAEK